MTEDDKAEQPNKLARPAQELFPRLRDLVRQGTTELADTTMVIDRANYVSTEIARLERKTVFTDPLLVAASAQVAGPGDYTTMTVIDTPLVVIRGADGQARVFVNACRHRGAQVAQDSGCQRRFTCPYHAWTYDDMGALVGMPGAEGFDGSPDLPQGLTELPSAERHGFIWCVLDPDGAVDLDQHLGPLEAHLVEWDYEDAEVVGVLDLDIAANWKCGVEAFQETYHFPYVHADSILSEATIANTVTFDGYGQHHCLGTPMASMREALEFETSDDSHLTVLYYLYPGATLAASPMSGELLLFFPGNDPGSCRLRHLLLSRGPIVSDNDRAYFDWYRPMIQAVIRDEDVPVIESSGRGLAAGLVDVVLGRNEPGCQNFHRQLQARMDEGAA